MPVEPELVGAAFAVGAALMTATTSTTLRMGTDSGRASDALAVVLLCNVVVLVPLAAVLHYPDYGITTRSLAAFALAGLVGTLLGRAFYFTSIETIGASRSDAIKASQPLHATLIAFLVLDESLTAWHLVGILFVMAGIGLVSVEMASDGRGDVSRRTLLVGLLLPLAASFFYGIEPTFAKIGFADGTPLLVGLSIKTLVATVGFVGYLRFRGALPTRFDYSRANLPWYVAAGLANTAFLGCYYAALELARVNVAVPLVQTSPFFVLLISYLALPRLEQITPRLVAGAAAVVSGAVVVVRFA